MAGRDRKAMPRALRAALAVVVALAAVVGVLLFVQSRDKSQVDATPAGPGRLLPDQGAAHRAPAPGFRYASTPPSSGPHVPAPIRRDGVGLSVDELLTGLELGDVALVYAGHQGQEQVLRAIQSDVSGPFDPALAQTGQMVLLDRRPGTKGVLALAWRRRLEVASVNDPRLRAFAESWLGRGARGQ